MKIIIIGEPGVGIAAEAIRDVINTIEQKTEHKVSVVVVSGPGLDKEDLDLKPLMRSIEIPNRVNLSESFSEQKHKGHERPFKYHR